MKPVSIIFFLFACLLMASCQKELDDSLPTTTPTPTPTTSTDSAWYIGSFTRIGLEYNDVTLNDADTARGFFTYLPNSIINREYYFSNGYSDSVKCTYTYDANRNLTKFECVGNNMLYEVTSINFLYANNLVSEADIVYFNGTTSKQQFSYAANNKIITVTDNLLGTSPMGQIFYYRYYLNNDNAVDSVMMVARPNVSGTNDTSYVRINYDAQKNIRQFVSVDRYSADTTNYLTRETRGGEIASTLKKIYANLYYHLFMYTISSDALIFNDDVGHFPAHNAAFPVITARQESVLNGPTNGLFINTFDANNFLTKQVVPNFFGSKQFGPSIFNYSYIKTKK